MARKKIGKKETNIYIKWKKKWNGEKNIIYKRGLDNGRHTNLKLLECALYNQWI